MGIHRSVADGAALGLLVVGVEAAVVAVGAAMVGGTDVLGTLIDDLALWGLGYLLVGAALGPLDQTRLGAAGPPLGWLAMLLLGDTGVVPRPLHALLIAAAVVAWLIVRRLPDRLGAALPMMGSAALAAAVAFPRSAPVPTGEPSEGPDIVVIVVDTLRADRLGSRGYPRDTTPNLDRMAARGLSFHAARATSSWTLPSHASLFTGLIPAEHGATARHPRLDPGAETLAEALDERGYRTVGLSANAWVSGGTGLDRGFERFAFLGDSGFASQLMLPLLVQRPSDLSGRTITDQALRAVAEPGRGPLFLFVNYLEAHEPLGTVPNPKWPADPLAGREWMREMPYFWCECTEDAGDLTCADGLLRAPQERIDATIDAYDAGVAYVDGLIGEVLRATRVRPTLVIVTSDHGERLGEEDRLGHLVWLDDALLDIPLIVTGPGLPRGAVDTAPIDLSELKGWVLSRVDGAPPPARRLAAISEIHGHSQATADSWETLFGCDFTPITTNRRVIRTAERTLTRENDQIGSADGPLDVVDRARLSAPFASGRAKLDPAAAKALEALGYPTPQDH